MKKKFEKMEENLQKLNKLDFEIKEFEKTLRLEKFRYSSSPPIYSPARDNDKRNQAEVISFGDSLNQRLIEEVQM